MANQPCNCPPFYSQGNGNICVSMVPFLAPLPCNAATQHAASQIPAAIAGSSLGGIGDVITHAIPVIALFSFGLILLIIGFILLKG